MVNKRSAILKLCKQRVKESEIVQRLKAPKQTVTHTIKRFKELGHDGDRPGRGRKRTVNTLRNQKVIKKRVQRNLGISMRKVAREMKIKRETARLMAKIELGPSPYKMKEARKLTAENKRPRLHRCKELLKRAAGD